MRLLPKYKRVGAQIPVGAQAEQALKPNPTVTTTADRLCCHPVRADDEEEERTQRRALTAHVQKVFLRE
jgi:hypothetical protein